MANYPTSLPSTTPADHTAVNNEIVAIATELGLSPSASYSTVLARLDDNLGQVQHWGPEDHGFLAWSIDPYGVTSNTIPTVAGTMYTVRLRTVRQITVTNVILFVSVAGATLTAGNCRAALYDSSGTLYSGSMTADMSTVWNNTSPNLKIMALGAAQSVAAGYFDIGFWWNGTTGPGFAREGNSNTVSNMNLTGNSIRVAQTSNTGLTNTAPATTGTKTAHAGSWFAAVS